MINVFAMQENASTALSFLNRMKMKIFRPMESQLWVCFMHLVVQALVEGDSFCSSQKFLRNRVVLDYCIYYIINVIYIIMNYKYCCNMI